MAACFRISLNFSFVGPPGTGKTFVGLKIVQTILRSFYHKDNLSQNLLRIMESDKPAKSSHFSSTTSLSPDNVPITPTPHNKIAAPTNRPILLVCYTNHALDQFMEGVLEFCPEKGRWSKSLWFDAPIHVDQCKDTSWGQLSEKLTPCPCLFQWVGGVKHLIVTLVAFRVVGVHQEMPRMLFL